MNPERARTPTDHGTRAARRVATTAVAAVLVTAAAACGSGSGGGESGDRGDATPGATTAASPVSVPLGDAGAVALLTAGAAPHRVLSYSSGESAGDVRVDDRGSSTTSTPGAAPTTSTTPPQTLLAGCRVEPGVDGAQRVVTTVREFTSTDPQRSAQYATGVGFELGWVRSPAGALRELTYAAPEAATDVARAGLEVLSRKLADAAVPMPAEAVGVGARWTLTRAVDDAVAPTRVVTYEVTQLTGDRVTVSVRTSTPEVRGTLQATTDSGRQGPALEVRRYVVTDAGTLTVDLRGCLPVAGTLEARTEADYADPDSGGRTTSERTSRLGYAAG